MAIDPSLVAECRKWIDDDPDPQSAAELKSMLQSGDEAALRTCFQGLLEFGTAGLRGRMGPGPSQMNRAVVSRAAGGIARYMKDRGLKSVVIGRDSRHGSERFAEDSAEIFSGAGFDVFILPRPLPTPILAFALRDFSLDVGVMVTASHNPASDNGYKVYLGGSVDGIDFNGSQIIAPTDKAIFNEIKAVESVKALARKRLWKVLDEAVIRRYIHATARIVSKPRDIKVVYTAMHGVGTETFRSVFHAAGFAEPILVDAQAHPDPDFPTVAFPNPEEKGAMDLALETAKSFDADLVVANDPDADRCAIAVKDHHLGSESNWRTLRGDEVGAILGEHIASNLNRDRKEGAVLANSIVSSSILAKIAKEHQIAFTETLTGFKWLAKVKGLTFGYEEALGYAVDPGTVNDKDGISAGLLITDIAATLKESGSDLLTYLDGIWQRYGFHATKQISIRLSDMAVIPRAIDHFKHGSITEIAGFRLQGIDDLSSPTSSLPPTEGIRLWLEREALTVRLIIRPSGTEAKLKCYLEAIGARDLAERAVDEIGEKVNGMILALLS
ncbi:MAG: phospho-sugar mutase [Actinobacteria bacterium]|nr:phospho-sugar mutase [Actinomycetota bacterium]